MQAGQQEAAEEEHEYHGTRVCEEKDRKEASVPELQAEVVKKYDDIRALSAAIANKERDIKDLNARMTHGRRVGAESSLCVTRATWATMAYQRGGSVQSNVKAAEVSVNVGRDDLPGHVLSAARPSHVLPSGESRHWWLRGASRPRGHQ